MSSLLLTEVSRKAFLSLAVMVKLLSHINMIFTGALESCAGSGCTLLRWSPRRGSPGGPVRPRPGGFVPSGPCTRTLPSARWGGRGSRTPRPWPGTSGSSRCGPAVGRRCRRGPAGSRNAWSTARSCPMERCNTGILQEGVQVCGRAN